MRPRKKNKMTSDKDERELRNNLINEFTCCEKAFTFKDFKEHLQTVHKLLPEQLKGNKRMVMHLDSDTWFSSTYEWTLETGLKFSQYTMMARDYDDPMRHG